MDVGAALAAVRSSGTILEGLRAGEALEDAARKAVERSAPRAVDLLVAATVDPDPITAIAAVRALGAHGAAPAAAHLVTLLDDDRGHVAEHAVEALGEVAPQPAGIPDLVQRCAQGGFAGMLAQRTLERWAVTTPDAVIGGATAALAIEREPGARARLVETVGLVPSPAALQPLTDVALDDGEGVEVRAAAVAALGDLLADPGCRTAPDAAAARAALDSVAGHRPTRGRRPAAGSLHQAAAIARSDGLVPPRPAVARDGLTVAQLFLHGDVDGTLRHSGQGDTGGIATLLVHLGDALLRRGSRVHRVLTISGGWGGVSAVSSMTGGATAAGTTGPGASAAHATAGRSLADDLSPARHLYARVPMWGHSTGMSTAWPRRVEARRGIRRVLRAAGQVDVLHLRMADVGSLVAAEVATELGIPVVLTRRP